MNGQDKLRNELLQVAAVAVAWVEDITFGSADILKVVNEPLLGNRAITQSEAILEEVWMERRAQQIKFGVQRHEPWLWLAILAEEMGEAAREVDEVDGHNVVQSEWALLMISMLKSAEDYARRILVREAEENAAYGPPLVL